MRKLTWGGSAILLGALALGAIGLAHLPFRPIINITPSEPYGLYDVTLFNRAAPPNLHLGEMVLFQYIAPSWAIGRYDPEGAQFLKKVGAVPGEYLFTRKLQQWVCPTDTFGKGCQVLGQMMVKDPKGRPMHWPVWNGYRIPAGRYYMQSTLVTISYDSRYYGLVSKYQLIGHLHPLLTFGH